MPSSVIKMYDYLPGAKKLIITFVSGVTYEYYNVPQKVYDGFKKSISKGTYFNRFIKPTHACEKLGP